MWQTVLNPSCDDQLTAIIDDSCGNCFKKNGRSRSGILVKYGSAVVAASTNLKKCVSLNSTEAEYVALSEAVKAVVWIRNVLTELVVEQISPCIFQDNVGFTK